MLLVANINSQKQIKMSDEQKKLFGIDKLNVKDLKYPLLLMLIIQLEFKLFLEKLMKDFCDLISNSRKKLIAH